MIISSLFGQKIEFQWLKINLKECIHKHLHKFELENMFKRNEIYTISKCRIERDLLFNE